jgi:predicted dehydrogenase
LVYFWQYIYGYIKHMTLELGQDDTPVKLGIIGSGLAVKWLHWPFIVQLAPAYMVVFACDIDAAAAQEIVQLAAKDLNNLDCRWTQDYREVLASPDVEAVLISLPIHLNAQVMREAAQAGKHILCEKPLASNLEQARELVASLRRYDKLVIEIAENFHYREDFAKAQEWIKAGLVGNPYLIEIQIHFWSDIEQGYASTLWRQDNQYRGGVLADVGVHHAAGMRILGGEVEQLQAFTKSVHPVMGGLDTLILNVRFRSGALGTLTLAGASENAFFRVGVYGTKGTIEMTHGHLVLLQGKSQNSKVIEDYEVPNFNGGYLGEFENFYQAIRKGVPVVATLDEALRDMTIIMQALHSAETRTVVLL